MFNMSLKIGVMINKSENLKNWELRIIDEIMSNSELKLSLLIQEDEESKREVLSILKSKNLVATLLLKIQAMIEGKKFKTQKTANKEEIVRKLMQVKVITVASGIKGALKVFSKESVEIIRNCKLDIIFKLGFDTPKRELLKLTKHGVWFFCHSYNSNRINTPIGFWETMLRQPCVYVTLQKLTSKHNLILDEAFFNRHQLSFVATRDLALNGAISLLFKNFKKLHRGECKPLRTKVHCNNYNSPNIYHVLRYILGFYAEIPKKLIRRIETRLLGARYDCWTLFIGKGDFMQSDFSELKPLKVPRNKFWADPFIFFYKNNDYIFFESYDYIAMKGKISCGIVKDGKMTDIVDVLDANYHLSYPYIFEDEGNIFLMPETSENNRLELYICIDFPGKWELYSTAFSGEGVVDATFYIDKNKQRWLFINKRSNSSSPFSSELFIYKVGSLKFDDLVPHSKNPVVIDCRSARSGGNFFEYKGEIYRPSQANIDGIYGRALNIGRVKKLTIDDYIEVSVKRTYPNFYKGLISTHHLSQADNFFVIDAAHRKL
jgi:hypothetical protein